VAKAIFYLIHFLSSLNLPAKLNEGRVNFNFFYIITVGFSQLINFYSLPKTWLQPHLLFTLLKPSLNSSSFPKFTKPACLMKWRKDELLFF
jgi:hypothetical protein